MLKSKMIIIVLLLSTISICLYPVDSSIAGECSDKGAGVGTPTVIGNSNYSEDWNAAPELDPSIPEEIAPNSSIPLTVSGGCAPYIWSVSGTGFTLETEGEPTGPTNTLYADGSACGSATITVTGCVGPPITGYVRCTTGVWGDFVEVCTSDGSCWLGGPGGCPGLVIGIYKYYTACHASWIPGNNCNEEASAFPCGSVAACTAKGGYIFSACYQKWVCP